jgi:acyl-CoA thioester hydrolase
MNKPSLTRHDFSYRQTITTRWTDNDVYGHVNNAVYYQYFDSVINAYLIGQGGLDIHDGAVVGFVVSSSCDFLAPVAYPAALEVGLSVSKLGRSSVTYSTGLFQVEREEACAAGRMVHVFVDAGHRRPVDIPHQLRAALQRISREPEAPPT